MKIDKEYPATHSMSTAWYCVDVEGNVGIVDIHDNGPIPNEDECEQEKEVNDIFWYDFSSKSADGIRDLNLTPDQIRPLLMPLAVQDEWVTEEFRYGEIDPITTKEVTKTEAYICNDSWSEVIIKIDMTKLPILLQAASLAMDGDDIVCLSRKEGLFFVSFTYNREGVQLLEKNQVVIARYKAPCYDGIFVDDEESESKMKEEENQRFPVFIYNEEWMPNEGPAKRMSNPAHPLKIEQLPKKLRDKATRLPINFKDKETLQLAEHISVYVDSTCVSNWYERWKEIRSSNNETVYYGEESRRILTKEELDELGKQWIKENSKEA